MLFTVTDPPPAVRPPDQPPSPADAVRRLPVLLRRTAALVAEGLSNDQIGRRLHASEGTVKGRLTRLFELLGVENRTQVALAWLEATGRLVRPGELDALRARLDAACAALVRIRRGDQPTDAEWDLAAADLVLTADHMQPDDAQIISAAALVEMRRIATGGTVTTSDQGES